MLLGCIADDFTGASDLANTLAKGGMNCVQFVGVPSGMASRSCEAGIVSLKTRSIPADQAVAQSLTALDWLLKQGCTQILFKYCSTFDSTPEGNIGPVAEALAHRLRAKAVIVCPVFPATGRTLYMGHLFVQDRLLSESGMEKHPLTPMSDPDIRRWLLRQTTGEVGLVPFKTVKLGRDAIREALAAEAAQFTSLVVVDAIQDTDLMEIGAAIADHKLLTGGSGIAMGLPQNFRAKGKLSDKGSEFVPTQGPGLVLSGSCSITSQAQVAEYLKSHPGLAIAPDDLMAGVMTVERAMAFLGQQEMQSPILYSTANPEAVKAAQARFGREEIADKIESFFGEIAQRSVANGITRLVVGGGETSGAVVSALNIQSLNIGPEIAAGVPALAVENSSLRLVLKSGNFGQTDFYVKALNALGTA